MHSFLRKLFGPVSGFLLGCLVFLIIYGLDPLRVTGSAWIFNGVIETDILQHYAGWMFFRDSSWSWPLGLAINMGYPIGANISYTDSIPIVSIFFKLISSLLPEHFLFQAKKSSAETFITQTIFWNKYRITDRIY
ncbi:MAG: DUF6311 domain-containing protein [Flexilinea sp.]